MKKTKDTPELPKVVGDALEGLSRQERENLLAVWHAVERYDPVPIPDEALPPLHLEEDVELQRHSTPRQTRAGTRIFRLGFSVAATLLLAGFGWFLWVHETIWVAPPEQVLNVSLPDGSRVELKGGARVVYRTLFNRLQRKVQFKGEAFFDVTEGTMPFVITAPNARISVLGTRFHVQAGVEEGELRTVVMVEKGQVQVAPLGDDTGGVILGAGEMSFIEGPSGTVAPAQEVTPLQMSSWRQTRFSFEAQPLSSIFETVSLHFGVEVAVASHVPLDQAVTYIMQQPLGIEALLRDVCALQGLQVRQTSSGYEVY